MKDEHVLVVPTASLSPSILLQQGFVSVPEDLLNRLIRDHGLFMQRKYAETDESYRQVIPYIILGNQEGEVLVMKRLDTQGEKRLHNLYSLGVGGHVHNLDSEDPLQAFQNGLVRELHEEVDVDLIKPLSFLGLINDSETPVGRVHIGAAYQGMVHFRRMNEPDQFEHQWVQRDQVTLFADRMEGWSKILWKEWIKPR